MGLLIVNVEPYKAGSLLVKIGLDVDGGGR